MDQCEAFASGGSRIRLRVGGVSDNEEEITAIEVIPKWSASSGKQAGAIVRLAAEEIVVGTGDDSLLLTAAAAAVPASVDGTVTSTGTKGHPARIAAGTGQLHLEAPSGIAIDGREGPVRVSATAGIDVRAGGGARLRLGGASGPGGIGALEGEGVLLEAPGGSLRTSVNGGVEVRSGTAKMRVSSEFGAAIDGKALHQSTFHLN